MPKFSIIIPCFNSFKLMNKCLESLENQTFQDFEVIIIDDCSTDDSYQKLKEYQKHSNLKITLLKNEHNLGPGKTRNLGIEKTSGEYITFIDSDDHIENSTLEILNNVLLKDETIDCIIYNYNFITKHNVIKRKSINKSNSQYVDKKDVLIYANTSTFCKVYYLKNIKDNNITFPDLMRNEDFVFNKLAFSVSNKIYYCNENLYNYEDNPISLMHNQKYYNENNNMIGFELVEKYLKNRYDEELEAIFITECLYAMTLNLVGRKASRKQIKEHINNCLKKYPNLYKNENINNLNIFQRACIKATKIKSVLALKLLLKLKKIIKKTM